MNDDYIIPVEIEDFRIHVKWIDDHLLRLRSLAAAREDEFLADERLPAAAYRNLQTCIRSYMIMDGFLGLVDSKAREDFHARFDHLHFRSFWLRILNSDFNISPSEIREYLPASIHFLTQFSCALHSALEREL
jgi:hypothetical protein